MFDFKLLLTEPRISVSSGKRCTQCTVLLLVCGYNDLNNACVFRMIMHICTKWRKV